jgi:hypothetical protein
MADGMPTARSASCTAVACQLAHGEVARPDRAAVERRARAQQTHGLGGDVGADAHGHQVLVAALRLGRQGPAPAQHRVAVADDALLRRFGGRAHFLRGDARIDERPRVADEQRVRRRDERLGAAVVGVEREGAPGVAAGAQVGAQVGAAEAVDRLLGVADQEQRPVGEAGREDRVLQRIGVLELVDQRDLMTAADGAAHGVGARRVAQRRMGAHQQVVEGGDMFLALALFDPLLHRDQQLGAQVRERLADGRLDLRAGVEERTLEDDLLVLRLVQLRAQRVGRQPPQRRDAGVRGAAQPRAELVEVAAERACERAVAAVPRVRGELRAQALGPQRARPSHRRCDRIGERAEARRRFGQGDARVPPPQPVGMHQRLGRVPAEVQQGAAHVAGRRVLQTQRVGGGAEQQRQAVGLELGAEGLPGLERRFVEQSLAEAVDRVHRDLVEVGERAPAQRCGLRLRCETGEERVVRRLAQSGGEHAPQAVAQPALEFVGRRHRERDDERVVEPLDAAFEQQPQQDADERVRLAGASARFQQHHARLQRRRREFERRQLHASSSQAARASPTRSAQATNSGCASGSRPRQHIAVAASSASPDEPSPRPLKAARARRAATATSSFFRALAWASDAAGKNGSGRASPAR